MLNHGKGWQDSSMNRSFQAVAQAGFNKSNFPTLRKIFMVSEPESAAFYIMKSLQDRVGDELRIVHKTLEPAVVR